MASYQSVVNINIIIKFLIGLKAFVSLCSLLLSLIQKHNRIKLNFTLVKMKANI